MRDLSAAIVRMIVGTDLGICKVFRVMENSIGSNGKVVVKVHTKSKEIFGKTVHL